ncbi:hypothetical protein Trydic_g11087 [Trypoxylus dichotomus]
MIPQKSSKMRNLRNCLILIHVRHLKNCPQHWMLIDDNSEGKKLGTTRVEEQEKKEFLHRIITGDEKWIHYDHPKRTVGEARSIRSINAKAQYSRVKG